MKQENSKKRNGWLMLLCAVGFVLTYAGMSTEDARDKMPPEQAKTKLASPKNTFGMMGVGLITMVSAVAIAYRREKGSR